MNLDLCNSQSGTDKMLQLKGKNTSQATLESTESSESNLGGDTVPTIIVIILIQSLHSAVPAEEMGFARSGVAAEGTRGTGAFGHCSVLTVQRSGHPSCSRHVLCLVMDTDLECKVSKEKKPCSLYSIGGLISFSICF